MAVPIDMLGLAESGQRSRRCDPVQGERQSLAPVIVLVCRGLHSLIGGWRSLLTSESNTVSKPLTTSEAPINRRVFTFCQTMLY